MKSEKSNKKQKKSELKSALLNEGGAPAAKKENLMMNEFKDRMQVAHRRMSNANVQKKGINLGVMKGMQKASEGGKKLAKCMTPKVIFMMYGIIDLILFVLIIAYTIAYKSGNIGFIGLILMYLPNAVLFIVLLIKDSFGTRKMYQLWLRFKLVFMGFMLPLIFLHQAESHWESAICSRQLEQYNITMTQDEMQNIIDQKEFSLLLGTDNMQLGESQIISQETKYGEFANTDMGIQDVASTVGVDNAKGLTDILQQGIQEKKLQYRYIQFCGTSVVLGSLAVIVVYQMFQGHQYFVARGRYRELLEEDEKFKKNMVKFESGDPDFLLKELQSAADALSKQVELKRRNSIHYSDATEAGTNNAFSTAIN